MAAEHPAGNDAPIRHTTTMDDGRTLIVYRASAIGGCDRAFVAAARGMEAKPPPERMQAIFDEGHEAEPQILQQWDEANGGVDWGTEQTALELVVIDDDDVKVVVRGHVDCLSTGADGVQEIIECKKFRDSTWQAWMDKGVEVHATYPWQVSVLMHAWHQMHGDYPFVTMVGGRWSTQPPVQEGNVIPEPLAEPQVVELAPHYITNPPIPLRAIKKKVAKIEGLIEQGYDPTDPDVACTQSYPCGYWYLHPDALAGGKKTATDSKHVQIKGFDERVLKMLIADMTYAAQLRDMATAKAKIDGARRANREMLQVWMQEHGVSAGDSASAMGYELKWVKREVKAYEVKARTDEWVEVKPVEKKTTGKTKTSGKAGDGQTGDNDE